MLSIGVGETVTDGFKTYVLTCESRGAKKCLWVRRTEDEQEDN